MTFFLCLKLKCDAKKENVAENKCNVVLLLWLASSRVKSGAKKGAKRLNEMEEKPTEVQGMTTNAV